MNNNPPIGSAAGGSLRLDRKQCKGYEAYTEGRVLELRTVIGAYRPKAREFEMKN
jgi:hypothetical protein